MDVGADDFRFPIFHLARLTLESDKGQEAEEIYRQMQGGGMGEGKKRGQPEKNRAFASLNCETSGDSSPRMDLVYALRKKREKEEGKKN